MSFGRPQGGAWPNAEQQLLLRACLAQASTTSEQAPAGAPDKAANTQRPTDWAEWLARVDFDGIDHASLPLLPLLDRRLEQQANDDGLESAPDAQDSAIRGRIRGVRRRTWVVNQRLLKATLPLVHEFQQGGCCPVLLRGAALIASTYEDPSLRPLRNVDVLVREERWQPAAEILTRSDWLPERPLDPAGLRVRNSVAFTKRPAGGSAEEPPHTLQLHRHVLPDHADSSLDQVAREKACQTTLQEQEVSVLDPFHALLLVCGYGISWRPTVSLVWAADTSLLLQRYGETIEWSHLLDTALRLGVFTSLRATLLYVADELGAPLPGGVRAELRTHHPSPEDRLHWWAHTSSLRGSTLGALPAHLLQWRRRGIFTAPRRKLGAT